MTQDEMKKVAGWAALKYVVPGTIVGVGTGSPSIASSVTLATTKDQIKARCRAPSLHRAPSRSRRPVFDLNDIDALSVYVDGADEISASRER